MTRLALLRVKFSKNYISAKLTKFNSTPKSVDLQYTNTIVNTNTKTEKQMNRFKIITIAHSQMEDEQTVCYRQVLLEQVMLQADFTVSTVHCWDNQFSFFLSH